MKIILYTGEVILCRKIEVSMFLVDEPKLIIDESYAILLADVHAIIDNKGGRGNVVLYTYIRWLS